MCWYLDLLHQRQQQISGFGRAKLDQAAEMDWQKTLHNWQERISQELDSVVDFWLRHSHDKEYGWASISKRQLFGFVCSASQGDAVGL